MENYPLSKEETSLLTLSRRDLSSTKNDKIDDSETLVLMQMPASMSAKDIQGARIIASPSQQACLVLKDTSYSMSRVETSNAYIMVPPMTPSSLQERPRKKCKTTDTTLVSVPARLLQSGGSGASFIELKKKNLLLSDLEKQLQYCVFDPFDASKTWTGKPIDELAVSLQCSETQVLQGLKRIQALGITNEGTTCYGLLSEEALQEAKTSILATLMECDDFSDYAGTGISEKTCVEQVMSRVPSGETYTYMDQVIQHTLRTLQSDDNVAGDGDKIQLDVKKVAVCVVHRLFSKQSEPWDEQELLTRWQQETPGVGETYQVSLDMLSGVALLCGPKKWKYFSEEKLPADLDKRFDILFAERERWTLDDLKPYVQRLTTGELSETDLLLKYTNIVTDNVDGVSTKFYVRK